MRAVPQGDGVRPELPEWPQCRAHQSLGVRCGLLLLSIFPRTFLIPSQKRV